MQSSDNTQKSTGFTPPGQTKWSEIEYLPEWDEPYYDVYTAKKFGKWLMLKTLKPQLKDNPEYRAMLEKEFEVRYNLAHPNIVMINDFEDVPSVGMSIITDDVYGDSLARLIAEGRVGKEHVDKLAHQLVDAMDYIQTNHIVHHPIRAERIIFTEDIGNLKLIDVGFDQKAHLEPADAAEDIRNFGLVMLQALDASGVADQRLRRVAERAASPDPSRRYHDVASLRMAIAGQRESRIYIAIIAFLVLMIGLLVWLTAVSPRL